MNAPTLKVLIGNSEATYTATIRLLIEKVCKPTKRCEFTVVQRLEGVLAEADRNRFDLCILILNNLLAPEIAGRNRIEQTIAAIGDLKARCPMPVIALSGYADFQARVRQAGSRRVFAPAAGSGGVPGRAGPVPGRWCWWPGLGRSTAVTGGVPDKLFCKMLFKTRPARKPVWPTPFVTGMLAPEFRKPDFPP